MASVDKNPKVSVCVISYNQEKYIRACLQSIVDQVTDFDFEVIVGDDCSSDGTRNVILEFARQYPGLVIPNFYENKVGGTQNYVATHNLARGKFVAHIDGDDLALPGKLQMQADYLEKHPDCAVVWHRMYVFDDAGSFCVPNLPDLSMYEDGKLYLSDLLEFGSISYHSSTMYRAKARKTRVIEGDALDWSFNVEFLKSGYGKYLEPILGKYRYNKNTGISRKDKGLINTRKLYAFHLEHYLTTLPEFRAFIFINAVLHLLVDLKNRRRSTFYFLRLAIKSKRVAGISTLAKALVRYRQMNPRLF
ncbi:glycosyltransferase family 2 protein [Noviherbaspirillum sedimenti]|uniref:Glycosyltransferase family 2 protein n=1 Tax=Noviherbaspirillum sedimenti TaxID=2320865 RepID=A0A3A3G367_9BURK|nr:glycosyltransferase family A protein [Noviherbaspirillum sedimenti]RJG02933.1 glycosyltransferase family 2 protein [Noviherbaspirillum sedimenti]